MNCLRKLPDTKSPKLSILRSTPFRQFDSTETYYLIIKLVKLFFSEVKSSSAAVSTGLCTIRGKFYTYLRGSEEPLFSPVTTPRRVLHGEYFLGSPTWPLLCSLQTLILS